MHDKLARLLVLRACILLFVRVSSASRGKWCPHAMTCADLHMVFDLSAAETPMLPGWVARATTAARSQR